MYFIIHGFAPPFIKLYIICFKFTIFIFRKNYHSEIFLILCYAAVDKRSLNRYNLNNTSEEDFLNVWADYFDLSTDYGAVKIRLSADETLRKACEFAGGIRLLKQDKWECLCSFIISQNNNIPRIKGIISRLCLHYGHFPSPSELASETVESLGFLRSGFRAKYLIDAAEKTADGSLELEAIPDMTIENARKRLMTIKGVGPKVAECVLLFGMYKTEAFPIDVWIKRVMDNYYPEGLPDEAKGIEGIAQQYLFHYIRNLEKSKKDTVTA